MTKPDVKIEFGPQDGDALKPFQLGYTLDFFGVKFRIVKVDRGVDGLQMIGERVSPRPGRTRVIRLDEHRPHVTGKVQCLHCGHIWVAVVPEVDGKPPRVSLEGLQCPNCHKEPFMTRPLDQEEE